MNIYLAYCIIAAILVAAELVYSRIADRFNIIDKPNERSSHTKVVLRGGGIIFVLGMWIYAAFFGVEMWPFLLGLTLVAGISFVDDIHSLPDSVRLVVQFVAMFLMFYQWNVLNWESWWIVLAALILCVGITNAYIFMDGINGINGGYTLAVLLPLAWLNSRLSFVVQRLIVVALLADLVFCWFNFRPKGKAKCFAGDVGSIGMALILVFCLGRLMIATGDITWIVLFLVYGVDGVLTICHRIMLHENLGQAHRKHAYQLMANELKMSHVTVSIIYMGLQLAVSLGFIYLIPNTIVAHWIYLVTAALVLAVAYVLFKMKYYHLHVEYLASLKK